MDRSHRRVRPDGSRATRTTLVPSGEITAERSADFSGRTMERRVCLLETVTLAPGRSRDAAAPNRARAATPQAIRSRFRRRGAAGAKTPAADPSAIHLNSLPTSPALCQRSSGSFAMQVFTTRSKAGGDMGCTVDIDGGSEVMIEEINEAWLVPENAFFPVAIS